MLYVLMADILWCVLTLLRLCENTFLFKFFQCCGSGSAWIRNFCLDPELGKFKAESGINNSGSATLPRGLPVLAGPNNPSRDLNPWNIHKNYWSYTQPSIKQIILWKRVQINKSKHKVREKERCKIPSMISFKYSKLFDTIYLVWINSNLK